MNKEYEHARVFITQPMLLNRSPSYGGKYVGQWGMIIKWYNQEGRTRYAVQLDGFVNPKSRDGLFWFDRSELNIYIEEKENEMGKSVKAESVFEIKEVIFNDPATIIKWADGTKTVVKCNDGDRYDPEKGMALAIAKKALGNQGNYYEVFKKWLPDREENFWMYLKDAVLKGVPRPNAKPIGIVTNKDPLEASFTCKLTDEAAEAFQKIIADAENKMPLGFETAAKADDNRLPIGTRIRSSGQRCRGLDLCLCREGVSLAFVGTIVGYEDTEKFDGYLVKIDNGINHGRDDGLWWMPYYCVEPMEKEVVNELLPVKTKVHLADNCNPLVLGFLAVAGIDKNDIGVIVGYEHDGYLAKFKGHTNLGRYDGLYWLHKSCVAVCND